MRKFGGMKAAAVGALAALLLVGGARERGATAPTGATTAEADRAIARQLADSTQWANPRGARGDLTEEHSSRVAASVWAISQARGEPWPGGHASHESIMPTGSTAGTAQAKPWTTRGRPLARPPQGSGR